MESQMSKYMRLLLVTISLLTNSAYSQDTKWLPLPDGMNVQLLRDTGNEHSIAFLVNLNSYQISSFHVESNLAGEQHYDTKIVGWTFYDLGDPVISITSYSTENWVFDADGGDFWWQNFENVSNGGNPDYKLIFRLQNSNFNDESTFRYYIDQVPEPATISLLIVAGLSMMFVSVLRNRTKGKA